jgi:hypothetical protein
LVGLGSCSLGDVRRDPQRGCLTSPATIIDQGSLIWLGF